MKRFLVRLGVSVCPFFCSWRFPGLVLGLLVLLALFYAEEDWRGARVWEATKAKWEAKGETFDYSHFIPPPIPEAQNLGELPLFEMDTLPDDPKSFAPLALEKAMRKGQPSLDLPSPGGWMRGKLPDAAQMKLGIGAAYQTVFQNAKPPESTLDQFDALYPFLPRFVAASVSRHQFRIPGDYIIKPTFARPLGILVDGIGLSRLITLQAVLALGEHRADLAFDDVRANQILLVGIKKDPTFLGGLVAIGMQAIGKAAVYDGIACHLWSDAQLAELERSSQRIDFLSGYQFALRCEAAEATINFDYIEHDSPSKLQTLNPTLAKEVGLFDILSWWPGGWWDQNKSQLITFHFDQLATVDPQLQRVYPEIARKLADRVEGETSWNAAMPWNAWFYIAAKGETDMVQKYARGQVWLDETIIACALERHHLAKGVYPKTLNALVPAYLDALPHDIMNGQSYHYRLRPDGTYLLYSVGWNEKDDVGVVVYHDPYGSGRPTQDDEQGDWVWPTPK